MLHNSTLGCNAFLGGISKSSRSNLYLDPASKVIIAEADEFDRSFLTLFPEIAVISSMDADHLDIYHTEENIIRGFESFIAQTREKGKLIHKWGLSPVIPGHIESYTYSVENREADYYARKIEMHKLGHRFTAVTPDMIIPDIVLAIPGMINVENSLAAIAVAHQLGIAPETIAGALSSYQGVERRFDLQVYDKGRIYIDDYAHHPEEIKAFLSSVRVMFPDKKLTGVFQPHLYSRTRDFASEFARSLEMLDMLILMEIYPAREEPIPGINASVIFDQVRLKEKVLVSREQLMKVIREHEPELLVTMGAGDINQFVDSISEMFKTRR
jgi:UDP-N-acetylmuramate--alanine ligase